MASITLSIDKELKSKMDKLSWVNWSEAVRGDLLKKQEIRLVLKRLESKEEKELIEWSVELGRKAKKDRFKKLLADLPTKERAKLLK